MAKLFLIPEEHAATVWPLAKPFIESALLHADGLLKIGELEESVADGRKQLWLVWDNKCRAAGVTELLNDTCFVWAFGGEGMREWFPLHTQLEAWAKTNGCSAVHFFGRLGWARVLRDEGYERRMVVMRKEL